MYFIHVFYAPKITPKQSQNNSAFTVILSLPPPSYRTTAAAVGPAPPLPVPFRRRSRSAAAPSSSLLSLLVHHG